MRDVGPTFRVVSDSGEIESLREQWSQLPQGRCDPLLSHPWLAAAGTLAGAGRQRFVVGERDGRMESCAPLQATRRAGVDWLEFAGSSILGEPAGLFYRDDPALDALCAALAGLGRPLALGRVPTFLKLTERLRHSSRGWTVRLPSPPALRVQFDRGWDSYLENRSAECRGGFRRKRRKLEEYGSVRFECLRPNPADVGATLNRSFDVEDDGWKGRSGSSVLRRPALQHFLLDVGCRFATEGKLLVHFLLVGSRPIATIVAVEHAGRVWELKVGYREGFAGASPGRLLLWEALRDACERGLEGYEFLGSGDGQQRDWANAERALETVVYYPYSLAGAAAFGADVARHGARRLASLRARPEGY